MTVRFYLCEVDKENVLQTSAVVKRLVADVSVLVEEEKIPRSWMERLAMRRCIKSLS